VRQGQLRHRPHDEAGDRQHHERGDQALEHAEDDLLQRHQAHRDRREEPIVDLPGEPEVGHHRQRHRLDARERQRYGQDAGQERGSVTAADEAHPRQEVAEHHHEQERLLPKAIDLVEQGNGLRDGLALARRLASQHPLPPRVVSPEPFPDGGAPARLDPALNDRSAPVDDRIDSLLGLHPEVQDAARALVLLELDREHLGPGGRTPAEVVKQGVAGDPIGAREPALAKQRDESGGELLAELVAGGRHPTDHDSLVGRSKERSR